jgi:hypothetical protein
MRTTVDIDDPILRDLKTLGKKEGKTLGRLISDLLAESMDRHKTGKNRQPPPQWITKAMDARLDLADREALYEAMESGLQTPEDSHRS